MKPTLTAFLLLVCTRLFSQAPDWTPTPSSGTVVAQIQINGLWTHADDAIATFE